MTTKRKSSKSRNSTQDKISRAGWRKLEKFGLVKPRAKGEKLKLTKYKEKTLRTNWAQDVLAGNTVPVSVGPSKEKLFRQAGAKPKRGKVLVPKSAEAEAKKYRPDLSYMKSAVQYWKRGSVLNESAGPRRQGILARAIERNHDTFRGTIGAKTGKAYNPQKAERILDTLSTKYLRELLDTYGPDDWGDIPDNESLYLGQSG